MSVLGEDVLCRFVRPCDWNKKENRPKPQAFKHPKSSTYSAWDVTALDGQDASIEDLQIEQFKVCGRSYHSAQDYHDIASDMAKETHRPYSVAVKWDPDGVPPAWEQWKYAHVRVDTPDGNLLPPYFRNQLALRSGPNIPPASLASSESF